MEQIVMQHKDNAINYIELVDKLTLPQTLVLDKLVNEITLLINQPDYVIDIDDLQIYYLKISTELYLMVEKLKQFEIYSSLAKSNETESYNKAYLNEMVTADKKPTVAELQIKAESQAKKESLVNTVYASAFKTIKSKIESGNNIADTLKNIIRIRTNIEFTNGQINNKF